MVPGWVQCQINLDLGDISMNWYNLCHTQTDIVYIQILTNMFKLSPNWSCVSLDGPSNWLPEKMQSHIGCICLTFLHCVSSNVSSSCLDQNRHIHTGCTSWFFSTVCFQMSPQTVCPSGCIITLVAFFLLFSTVFSNDSSNCLPEKMQSYTVCIC